ncbi:MAG: tetratricopeptide (TPR) repeat protein [Saprospiraceae bacterium]|jgi:tetratricopeptide (TPR) repeat protein
MKNSITLKYLDVVITITIMKNVLYIILFALVTISMEAQSTKGLKPIKKQTLSPSGVTRAVVVGISDYQNKDITDLQYAHLDARIFADYLLDEDGYGLDSSHVTVLLNEEATSGNFVSALYGLMEDGQEGDQIIIYFSGHGDVESTTISQPGFLLCWDAPARVYMAGGTFGLAYLQEIISTLSLKVKSKVVVITDACRSGKLAGSDIGGSQATAANLSKQYANEVKILSCQPDEFALEGDAWGGGRGVFSYFLMAGLKGMADRNEDGEVSLSELERYLEDNVSETVAPHSQIPMTVGQRNTTLSFVNAKVLQRTKEEMSDTNFGFIGKKAAVEDIFFSDTLLKKKYLAFNAALESNHLLSPEEGSAWNIFHEVKNYPEINKYEGLMRRNLAAALQDETQQVINAYLASSPEELARRWNFDNSYEKYPEYLEKACVLLGEDHFFYQTLQARTYYFKGLLMRLDAMKNDQKDGFYQAIAMQDSCILIDSTAAYAYNEKGFTLMLLEKYDSATLYYNKALGYTPSWPLVWSNLSHLYTMIGEHNKALEMGMRSLEIDSNFIIGMYNTGVAYGNLKQPQKAMLLYSRGLKLDPNSSLLNSKMGNISYKNGNYEDAEVYWLKSIEVQPNNVLDIINLGHTYLKKGENENAKKYFLKARKLRPNNEQAYQGIIEYYFYTGDMDNASNQLQAYVLDYPKDGMAHYLISSIAGSKNDQSTALVFIEKAFKNGMLDYLAIESDTNLKEIILLPAYLNLKKKYKK